MAFPTSPLTWIFAPWGLWPWKPGRAGWSQAGTAGMPPGTLQYLLYCSTAAAAAAPVPAQAYSKQILYHCFFCRTRTSQSIFTFAFMGSLMNIALLQEPFWLGSQEYWRGAEGSTERHTGHTGTATVNTWVQRDILDIQVQLLYIPGYRETYWTSRYSYCTYLGTEKYTKHPGTATVYSWVQRDILDIQVQLLYLPGYPVLTRHSLSNIQGV